MPSDTIHGAKFCKGRCIDFERSRPYRNPYEYHCLCRNCRGTGLCKDGVWMEVNSLNEKGRCPCCNRLPKRKSYRNKEKYIYNHK